MAVLRLAQLPVTGCGRGTGGFRGVPPPPLPLLGGCRTFIGASGEGGEKAKAEEEERGGGGGRRTHVTELPCMMIMTKLLGVLVLQSY